jgi:hypothetical protein
MTDWPRSLPEPQPSPWIGRGRPAPSRSRRSRTGRRHGSLRQEPSVAILAMWKLLLVLQMRLPSLRATFEITLLVQNEP